MSNSHNSEWIEEFDRTYGDLAGTDAYGIPTAYGESIKEFITQQIEASYEKGMTAALAVYNQNWYEGGRKAALQEVREKIEGKIHELEQKYHDTKYHNDAEKALSEAKVDLLLAIKQ